MGTQEPSPVLWSIGAATQKKRLQKKNNKAATHHTKKQTNKQTKKTTKTPQTPPPSTKQKTPNNHTPNLVNIFLLNLKYASRVFNLNSLERHKRWFVWLVFNWAQSYLYVLNTYFYKNTFKIYRSVIVTCKSVATAPKSEEEGWQNRARALKMNDRHIPCPC